MYPHLASLRGVARQQVGDFALDDVVQESLIRAWRYIDKYDPTRGSPRAWLMTILLNQCRRHRVRNLWLSRLPDNFDQPASRPYVEDAELAHAIQRLTSRQRQVTILYYIADLTISDVARVLNLSESAAKSHLSRGRNALGKMIGGGDHGS